MYWQRTRVNILQISQRFPSMLKRNATDMSVVTDVHEFQFRTNWTINVGNVIAK